MPLGIIGFKVTSSDVVNFHQEILSFEVVDFHATFHTVLGIPCFVKFMAVAHYAYLKMKMSSPNGVIMISRNL